MTFEEADSLFYYFDGVLFWKKGIRKDRPVGGVNTNGYLKTLVKGKEYRNHRIIYLLCHRKLPDYIDHIDGNPLNNKIENLREVTLSQNQMNTRGSSKGTSKYKGVSWHTRDKKWIAQIKVNKKVMAYPFKEETDAACMYNFLACLYFGNYARINDMEA